MSDKEKYIDNLFEDDIVETEDGIKKRKKDEMIEKLKEMGIKIFKIIGIIAVIMLIGWSLFSESNKNKDVQNVSSESELKETALKNELVVKYNAVVFDDKNFSFSKDIQDNFDKNFLLRGSVNDIYEKDGKLLVKMNDGYYYGVFEISSEQFNFIKNDENEDDLFDLFNDFFIVVKISDASKPVFKIDGEVDGGSVQLVVSSTDSFILKGKLIDIKKID